MSRRKIDWPYGNPQFDAWAVASEAGRLVIRRNHPPVARRGYYCQGWDVWLDGQYLGAAGQRFLSEFARLARLELRLATFPACCGRHRDFPVGRVAPSRYDWDNRRPPAGRPRKGAERRVELATTVDRQTLRWIDQQRGNASRGEFLDRLVRAASSSDPPAARGRIVIQE